MSKRLLIVSNSAGLVTDFLDNDCAIYRSMGYAIDCACNMNYTGRDSDAFFRKYEITPIHVDFPIRTLAFNEIIDSYCKLKEIIKVGHYDVLHCHSTIAAAISRACAKKSGLKVIYTTHGLPFYEGCQDKKARIYEMIEKHYSKFTDAIITICNEDYNNAKKMRCEKVYKINGVGVDFNRFEINAFSRSEYRKKLGLKDDRRYILSVGEINTNKNHKIVIEGIAKTGFDDISYLICGRELTEHGKKQELEELAKSLGVDVIFLGFRSDIPQICMCADIGAFPSLKEGLGLSGIEMLRAGLPIVGSNRQGIKDYVIDGVTGYLSDPTDVDSFAEAIRKTFELKKNAISEFNCITTANKYSKDEVYTSMKKILEEVVP